jgi:sugar O-acyltransferase (sialic acid O-acetyltransferase NeuD family)
VIDGVLIVGSSGHARVIVDIIERTGVQTILGLLDDTKAEGTIEIGYPVLGSLADVPEIVRQHNARGFLVAVGDNWSRGTVAAKIKKMAPELPAIVALHPSAQVARSACLGPGTAVMAGAVVNSNASVGSFCIINTRASIDHDSHLEDFASIGPGATLAGNVRVGAYSAICLQAGVAEKVCIGSHTVVGAGSVVLDDLPDGVLAFGTPARVVRSRSKGDRYLR